MNTTCPIATISYNSENFLKERLQELQRNHSISSWFFIFHYAEGQRPKDHFHVWMKPNKRLDTMTLQEFFAEDDPGNPDGPKLGCIDFVSSKIDFAILYYAHYKPYLTYIHQKRIYHYDWNQFVVSDQNWFDDAKLRGTMPVVINSDKECSLSLIAESILLSSANLLKCKALYKASSNQF